MLCIWIFNFLNKIIAKSPNYGIISVELKIQEIIMKKFFKFILTLAVIVGVVWVIITASKNHRSDPADLIRYETTNPYIVESLDVSAHRSGGGIAPEQTMMAFKNCVEDEDMDIDIFEFDLHITADDVLVLLHDSTLDRTSNAEEVFGETEVRPEDKTYEELRQLNMGAKFVTSNGEMPYADVELTDDLRILRIEDVLDYLMSVGDYKYIIEIKNEGDLGKRSMDILYDVLSERDLIGKTVLGTFNKEVTEYIDTYYTDITRSTSITEVVKFWVAALTNSDSYEPPCSVLQIPFCDPYLGYGVNLGTTTVINYAHEHDMAVQYWTINDPEDMEYLISIGADCIMTDYPDELSAIIEQLGE